MVETNIAYSINFNNEKINVRDLYGEYFRVDSDLNIKPSMRMENKMEEIIEGYLGDTENNDIKETMVKKLFTSRKPKVSKERKTIKDIVAVIEEGQKELIDILNSTSASLYNKEDYVYDYIGLLTRTQIYDITGEEYDKEEYEKKKNRSKETNKHRSNKKCLSTNKNT